MQLTIQLWLENRPGALMRVAALLSDKGCNIESLTVAPDPWQPGVSRMTVTADVEPYLHARVVNQMNRLVHVLVAMDVAAQKRGHRPAERLPIEMMAPVEPPEEVAC